MTCVGLEDAALSRDLTPALFAASKDVKELSRAKVVAALTTVGQGLGPSFARSWREWV